MVLDSDAECAGAVCTAKDKWICCKKRPRCLEYPNHVDGGCGVGELIANPYEFAFCQTYPCTQADMDMCCIAPAGQLWERLKPTRQYARNAPSHLAPKIEPKISFNQHKVAWINLARQQSVAGERWAPLVNFMTNWGNGAWRGQEAWVQVTQD